MFLKKEQTQNQEAGGYSLNDLLAIHPPLTPHDTFDFSVITQPTDCIKAAASSCLDRSQVSISSRRHLLKPIRTTGLGKSSCRMIRQRVDRDICMNSIMSRCLIRPPMVSPPFRIILISKQLRGYAVSFI